MSSPGNGAETSEQARDERYDVQVLRAVAVLLVALSHAHVPDLAGGFVGVDVFFVISGFLITGLLLKRARQDGRFSFAEFYARRALRILPAAVLVLVVTDLAARYMLPLLQAKQAVVDSVWALFFGANIHFADIGTDYFAQDQPPSAVQHYWSLAVEEQFYLVWPLILGVAVLGVHMFVRRGWRPEAREFRRVGLVLTVLVGASLVWSIVLTDSEPTNAYFSTLSRAWELGVGALIAIWATALTRIPAPARVVLGIAGLLTVGASAVLYTEATPFPGCAAMLPVLGTAALITAGLSDERGANWLLGRQPLRYIGDVSYSFYLWHWPVLILGAAWWGDALSAAANLGLLAGAFGIAVLSYHCIENPIRHGKIVSPDAGGMALTWSVGVAAVLVTGVLLDSSITNEVTAARVADVPPVLSSGDQPASSSTDTTGPPTFVLDAVQAARRGQAVPATTAPPLEVAAEDWDDLGMCSAYDISVKQIQPCTIGAKGGSRSIVLFGDSHAEMWVPAFREIGEDTGTTIHPLTKPGCGMVVQRLDEPGCGEWWNWAREQVETIHPDVIVISVRADTGTSWSEGMVELISAFRPSADRIIVLGDTPTIEKPAPECLQARGATLGDCAWAPNDAVGEADAAGPHLLNAEYVPVSQWFCADLCPALIGNIVVYIDADHVGATYSKQIAPLLEQRLRLKRGSAAG